MEMEGEEDMYGEKGGSGRGKRKRPREPERGSVTHSFSSSSGTSRRFSPWWRTWSRCSLTLREEGRKTKMEGRLLKWENPWTTCWWTSRCCSSEGGGPEHLYAISMQPPRRCVTVVGSLAIGMECDASFLTHTSPLISVFKAASSGSSGLFSSASRVASRNV